VVAVAYLGGRGPCACPPLQPTIIFYDGIFGCFTNFSSKTSKFRHSVTKKRQLLGDFCPPDLLAPLLLHILNTPLSGWKTDRARQVPKEMITKSRAGFLS